jgi:hypothetical protein
MCYFLEVKFYHKGEILLRGGVSPIANFEDWRDTGLLLAGTMRRAVAMRGIMERRSTLEIRKVSVSRLNPAEYNPRIKLEPGSTAYEQLARSLDEFGYIDPIIWNEGTGNVVGGHQRLAILTAQGAAEVEVSVVHLDEIKEKALNLALNKISGEWDDEKLSELLVELTDEGMIDFTGFTTMDYAELLGEDADPEPEGEPPEDEPEESGKESSFNYQEQYGVIVMCRDEADQQAVYEKLRGMGYECKVVAT